MSDKKPFAVFQDWLDSYLNFEKLPRKDTFWLDTMEYLCDRFDRPESAYRSVHVAGSKGKGSVSVMTSSILSEAGFSTGLYTSPHILDLTERIGTPYGPFEESVYEAAVKEIVPKVNSIIPDDLPLGREPTWFELLTLFSFLCYRNKKVDWVVFETGLGGRLDATNVINSDISIITPIELEHTEYLGDTLEKIAFEKAGIIKAGMPVVVALQQPCCEKVFRERAASLNSPIVFISKILEDVRTDISASGMKTYIDFGEKGHAFGFKRPLQVVLPLLGNFQAINAAVSAVAVKILYPEIDESIIESGLAKAVLPGRFEIIKNTNTNTRLPEGLPFVVLDGAHTENSVEFTLNTFNDLLADRYIKSEVHPHLLFACAADKHCTKFARLIADNDIPFSNITLTIPGSVKQSNLQKLCESFDLEGIKYESGANFEDEISSAFLKAAENHCPLLVTGSFYLVAEVKKWLLGQCTGAEKKL